MYSELIRYFQMPTLLTGAPLDDDKKARLDEALGYFEAMLKGRTWAAVNHFTIADLSLTISVSQIEAYGFDLTPYSRISTWLQRCKDFLAPHGYEVSIRNEWERSRITDCLISVILDVKR